VERSDSETTKRNHKLIVIEACTVPPPPMTKERMTEETQVYNALFYMYTIPSSPAERIEWGGHEEEIRDCR